MYRAFINESSVHQNTNLSNDPFIDVAKKNNRPFSYSEKNQNGTVFCYILSNFRMPTMLIEALTPLNRKSCIKMYKNNARSSFFCRIAKRSTG